ncbi:hypothetical protein [Streptomyces sp. NPDC054838]
MEQEALNARNRGFGRVIREGSVLAALVGAVIGALTGLVGSMLVYVQADRIQETAADDRRADIRRAAYVQLGTASTSFVTEMVSMSALIYEERTVEALERRLNDRINPATTRLVQAEMTARLVGTEESRALLMKTVQRREKLVIIILDASVGDREKFDSQFTNEEMKYLKAMNTFLDKVDEEVL